MSDLAATNPILASGTYTTDVQGPVHLSVGVAATTDFEDANVTVKIGDYTLTGLDGITAAEMKNLALPAGGLTTLSIVVDAVTSACSIPIVITPQ